MTWSGIFWGIGDFLDWTFQLLQQNMMGDILNNIFIIGIASGLLYWLFTQKKLSAKAANDPNQLK
ncbi:MAG: hypothetical protein COA33_011325 [Fluviicola sp.]|nr:hypothetical protein [Fluviicola sp.]